MGYSAEEYEQYYNYEVPDLSCPQEEKAGVFFADDMSELHCNSTFDTVICWPTTLAGHTSRVKCPAYFDDFALNPHANATKECFPNGTWASAADYSACLYHDNHTLLAKEEELHNFAIRVIYYVGFTFSTAALLIALFIFCYFRSLRCLRNSIHCHLMSSFVLKNILWIIMHSVLPVMTSVGRTSEYSKAFALTCQLIVAGYNYLQTANFFWMLVEGLYLHIMIVWAYSVDKIRIWAYAVLGWGIPFIFIFAWAIVRSLTDNSICWLPHPSLQFIYVGPILLVLLINTCCLVSTVYIIITKLKATNAQQTQQFWQALKGTLILFPLLGILYVVFITPPGDNPIARRLFQYFNATAQGLQGLMVAVFYCFLNREVRHVLKNRLSRWRDSRSLVSTRRTSIVTKADQSVLLLDVNAKRRDVKSNGQNCEAHRTFNANSPTNEKAEGGGSLVNSDEASCNDKSSAKNALLPAGDPVT